MDSFGKPVAKEKGQQAEKKSFWKSYSKFCYRILGRRMDERMKDVALAERLRRANLAVSPGQYQSMVIITGLIALFASLAASLLVFVVVLGLESGLLISLVITSMATAMALVILPSSVSMRISNRKAKIDRELPFSLSELSILASTGLSPIQVIRKAANRAENKTMMNEYREIIYKIDVEGKDIITALGETAKESPSDSFRETLWDLSNMIHQGGDLDEYLRIKADEIMQLKRDLQHEFIEKLASLSDVYNSLVLVGVLFIAIAAFLIDALGSSFDGVDANTLLLLLTYMIVPLAALAIGLVVTSAYSKTD